MIVYVLFILMTICWYLYTGWCSFGVMGVLITSGLIGVSIAVAVVEDQ